MTRRRALQAGLAALALPALAGCTAQPLYGTPSASGGTPAISARLASVDIAPPADRIEQAVRNHLIFLMRRGGAAPAEPAYKLDLKVSRREASSASIQRPQFNADQPTARRIELTGRYTLRDTSKGDDDAGDGQEAVKGQRLAIASFDLPEQSYSRLRAARDAEDRAARELAEQIYLALAQALAGA